MYYINIFFVYSILGFLIESLFCSFLPLKSGILYGPWTIVYGIGMTFVYLVYDKLQPLTKGLIDEVSFETCLKNMKESAEIEQGKP